jgi:hypothetical protein
MDVRLAKTQGKNDNCINARLAKTQGKNDNCIDCCYGGAKKVMK